LLKNIVSKLKRVLGGKSKTSTTQAKTVITPEEKKTVKKYKDYPQKKSSSTYKHKKTRKKETPEEYRLRHEKRAQNQKIKATVPAKTVNAEPWDKAEFKVPVEEGKTRFQDFELADEILHAIYDLEFKYCTDVQSETLPRSLAGEDVTAQAQTGTGKTAAFLLTIFNHFLKNPIDKKRRNGSPRALILAPTRELVLQIEKDARGLGKYIDVSILSLLGGIDYNKQQRILKTQNCDLLICTPGRLIDFIQKHLVDLGKVEILVIDEADRMLNMGFIPDVKKIVYKLPQKSKRQTMFFTATMNADVKNLSESWTRQAFQINVKPEEVAVESVEQITYITTVDEKPTLLYNVINSKNLERVLVFVNRRVEAKRLKDTFESYGISCALLTGDVDQKQRIRRLEKFREGRVRVLVATDVASRGIHVEAISHVINYNMPQDIEEYVHRIGRTGRAGATGISINFADEEDSHELGKLEEYLGKKIECTFPDDSLLVPIPDEYLKVKPKKTVDKKYQRKKKYVPRKRNSNASKGHSGKKD
jgi:ATP-dependent RNA helicase RhlB